MLSKSDILFCVSVFFLVSVFRRCLSSLSAVLGDLDDRAKRALFWERPLRSSSGQNGRERQLINNQKKSDTNEAMDLSKEFLKR